MSSLACAREQVKSAQWELTSLDPDYQPKQQVNVDVNQHVTVEFALTDEARSLVDRIRTVATQQHAALLQPETVNIEQDSSKDNQS